MKKRDSAMETERGEAAIGWLVIAIVTVLLMAACDSERTYSLIATDKEGRSIGATVTLRPTQTRGDK